MSPLISVILPVYNAENYIYESIQSILKQTFEDFELLILNDGSTDHSKQIIAAQADKRIRYFENRNNQGLIRTLNQALYFARGRFVARMDADDLCADNRLQKQLDFFNRNREVDILGTNQYIIGTNKCISHPPTNEENRVRLLLQPAVAHSSVMIKRQPLVNNKLYYDRLALHAEDYKLWVDASLCGLFIKNIPEYLCGYRIHDNQISKTQSYIQKKVADSIRLAYARYFFKEIISGNEEEYFLLLLGCSGRLPVEEIQKIEDICVRLIDRNDSKQYFSQQVFEDFFQQRLLNLKNK